MSNHVIYIIIADEENQFDACLLVNLDAIKVR